MMPPRMRVAIAYRATPASAAHTRAVDDLDRLVREREGLVAIAARTSGPRYEGMGD